MSDEIRKFDPQVGINNLGGSKEAYLDVLLTYYKEGVRKLESVDDVLKSGDISLYTTNVHALKSSSASVGAVGISPAFKNLELAGKQNNIEYINKYNKPVFDTFKYVLDEVEKYLISENVEINKAENRFSDSDEVGDIDKGLLNELSECIAALNLRRCDAIIEELKCINYGPELNAKLEQLAESLENFEYTEAKEIIAGML